MSAKIYLWEILIPVNKYNNDVYCFEFSRDHHDQWDSKIQDISGGLSILTPIKGKWISETNGGLIKEPMIPVRIACSKSQIQKIAQFTAEHYQQHTIMYYKISNNVTFHKNLLHSNI